MNVLRLGLAALAGLVAQFAVGFLLLWAIPGLLTEARRHAGVFRPEEEMMRVMPVGMAASLLAIVVAAILFAMIHPGGAGVAQGARFGALVGLFVVFGFVLHNYANLNIGLKLAFLQAVAYFVQWVAVGIVVALVYRPLAAR